MPHVICSDLQREGRTTPGLCYELEVIDNGLPVNGSSGDQISLFLVTTGRPPKTCPTAREVNSPEVDTLLAWDITVHPG